MSLTGTPLLIIVSALAVIVPIVLGLSMITRARHRWWLRICSVVAIGLAQLLAVGAAFLWVNRSYEFYSSWGDLLGQDNPHTAIKGGGDGTTTVPLPPGEGRTTLITIDAGPASNGNHQVLVWLPPQYDDPGEATTRFPVLLVLPGQPSTPQVMFEHFDFGSVASAEIKSGRTRPFIAVFPPLMTNPPRDTECTDIPHGPQAFSWLSDKVVDGVRHQLRTNDRPWNVVGWSTGGFCAAKLLLTHPETFDSAASMGGYYTPLTDHTTGNLFGGSAAVRNQNSPTWLFQQHGMANRSLLLVASRQDRSTYPELKAFLAVTKGNPGISTMIFSTGGHNYRNYRDNLPAIIDWLDAHRSG